MAWVTSVAVILPHFFWLNITYYFLQCACMSWLKKHPHNTDYGKPITVWEPDTFETDSRYHIIPIQFIACRTVSLIDEIDGLGNALFIIPIINF